MRKTTNYGKFKLVGGNRTVSTAHVKRLTKAIERKNLLKYFPIIVNDKMEIIDGQHRLMACVALDLPIYYEVVDKLDLKDTMDINTASKSWTLSDFVHAYIEKGRPEFAELKEFSVQNKLSLSISATLLHGVPLSEGGATASHLVRSGTFKINTPKRAQDIAEALEELQRHADWNVRADRHFIRTLWNLMNVNEFDLNRLVTKLKKHQMRIERKSNPKHYVLELEDIYNHSAKTGFRVDLYTKVFA